MRRRYIIGGLAAAMFAWRAFAAPPDPCRPPKQVQAFLVTLPGWALTTERDLAADDQALWRTHHGGLCPGLASADIDGGGRQSHVLLLIRRDGGVMQQRLVILPPKTAGRGLQPLLDAKPVVGRAAGVVWSAGPGKAARWDGGRSAQIAHHSFVYEHMEASATTFWRSAGRLHSLQTAD